MRHDETLGAENKNVRLLHDVAHCILYVSRSRILCWYVSEKRLSEVKVQDIQNALATRGMTARCSVGIHYSLANIFRSAEWFQVRSNEESLMVPHNVKGPGASQQQTTLDLIGTFQRFWFPLGPVEDGDWFTKPQSLRSQTCQMASLQHSPRTGWDPDCVPSRLSTVMIVMML